MKKIIYSSLLVLAITLLPSACDNDSDMNSPHGSTTPPEQVVLNGVKNLPGKSIIYFTQPSDKNFLYMKAVYMTRDRRTFDQCFVFCRLCSGGRI